ncbi:hypothetical protein [Nannocystis radixulma]|uniref:Baseplate assembly protein n=1 Tax=Nannocystis radixulma TaxID=2995305 RepID=A0ABT5BFF2_9BACT|nr:hypothetical protein [Nannocystis radixulma]MDC0672874.1 hypothetical protein [Nannocystis radixulma]
MYAKRIAAIKISTAPRLTAIDFVEVDPSQLVLRVHFHRDPGELDTPFGLNDPPPAKISITSTSGGEGVPVVRVTDVDVDGEVLELTVDKPGDFSRYRLHIEDPRIDYFFRSTEFTFKANCPDTRVDCKPVPEACPPADLVDFPVDYMARDFLSLRGALMDFAAQRYPQWRELVEADVGVMLLELFAALGDELSYTQDRMAREAFLETATQRRSVRRLVRLVDYDIHDGRSGSTFLDVRVILGMVTLEAGFRVWGVGDDGTTVTFEIGQGLADDLANGTYSVRKAWNALQTHVFDPDAAELPAGATAIFVQNPGGLVNPSTDWKNKWVLIHRDPPTPGEPPRRHLVFVTDVEELVDNLVEPPLVAPLPVLRLSWGPEHALPWCLKIGAGTTVHGNIVPATAGERFTEFFEIRGGTPDVRQAIEREGALQAETGERSVTFLHSLLASETGGLGRLGADLRATVPEVRVARITGDDPEVDLENWTWRRNLLSSNRLDEHYTLDDGTWRRVIGFQRATVDKDFVHYDYASGDGATIRFGDGEFGRTPADGLSFRVDYRTGVGTASNVAAGAIRYLQHPYTKERDISEFDLGRIASITNPLPVTDGVDPESLDDIRQLAPEEFRAVTHRAVKPEDYCEIVRRLDWVQVAGVRQRWTGSWPTTFVTPDPVGTYAVTDEQREELDGLMHCVRQAGREVYVRNPRFRAIDLEVQICVKPGHIPSTVRDAVLRRLRGDGVTPGYFAADTFTFGAPLQRLTIEAVVGAVPGVLAVKNVRIGARAVHHMRDMEDLYVVPDDQILRLASDPRTPERGSIRVITEGGV